MRRAVRLKRSGVDGVCVIGALTPGAVARGDVEQLHRAASHYYKNYLFLGTGKNVFAEAGRASVASFRS
jgi:hypothetical protein